MKTIDHAPPRPNRRRMVKGLAKSCTARAMAMWPSVLTRATGRRPARLLPNDDGGGEEEEPEVHPLKFS